MKERIVQLIKETKGSDDVPENIDNLVSGGYLDSMEVLMLISALEMEFKVTFTFNDEIFKRLESLEKIEDLIVSCQSGSRNESSES